MDFATDKGKRKLVYLEGILKTIYKEQCATKSDLEIRDQVIINVKNAFSRFSHAQYPHLLTGEIKISGFGSCQNGLWNSTSSDVDVTAVFVDRLCHN